MRNQPLPNLTLTEGDLPMLVGRRNRLEKELAEVKDRIERIEVAQYGQQRVERGAYLESIRPVGQPSYAR